MDREHLILREVVETYTHSGEAVGSKTISERLRHSLSSASIRAVMAALGQRGYLVQPHTSAGRVPTDLGWRVYLDAILVPEALRPKDRARVDALGFKDGVSPHDLMREAASLAAVALGAAAVVVAPSLERSVLRHVELIPLTPGRVLAIAVTEAGLVHERLLSVDASLGRADLERFTNFLNSLLPGRLLGEVRGVLEDALREAREKQDQCGSAGSASPPYELERCAAELGRRALDGDVDEAEILVEGASRVLAQREFTENPQLASELMRAVEEREVWLQLLASVEATGDTRVYVGEEAPTPALASCGLVVTRWTTGHASGVVAVFGPKRLDYRRAIPLVAQVARRLGGVLDGDGERGA